MSSSQARAAGAEFRKPVQESGQPDASIAIAAHLARTRFEDLPADVVAAAKASILDTIACLLAGTATDDVMALRSMIAGWGGRATSTVIGHGGLKVPASAAVFANGAAIHQFDFDDTHDLAILHPTSASLTPALAVAEEVAATRGRVAGREVITAIALANDISSRIGLATRGRMWDFPWFRAPVIGIFGATVAAAKVYGASQAQHLEALGLTLPQIGGTWASLHEKGSSVRSIRDGLAFRNGVLAAEMAMNGIRGDRNVLEGRYGFYQAYFNGEYERSELLAALGERYETTRISLKPWPCIRLLHPTLTALLEITQRERLGFDDIATVMLNVGQMNFDRCRPVALGSAPENHIDLAGNMGFAVGAAILHGSVPLQLYHDGALADEVVTRAMPKVNWRYDESLNGPSIEPGRVEITTRDGRRFVAESRLALGHPDKPMSTAQLHAKLTACAELAAHPLSSSTVSRIVETVDTLEKVQDIDTLMALLA
jgi:2-methylcitrate dehydratase PrpD